MRFNKKTLVGTVFFAFTLWGLVSIYLNYKPVSTPVRASNHATPISLSTYATASLTDVLNGPSENNLANLPTGRQLLAGVPFEISGIVHVSGKKIAEWGGRQYPVGVTNIPVNKTCSHIFLLQGLGGAYDQDGVTVGKLIIHYSDDSVRELSIRMGEHIRDWWGNPNQPMLRHGAELAWSGTNPAIQRFAPADRLRLYKSTFANPQPNLTIVTVDYVSMMRQGSPFMVGLTVE